MNDVATYRRLHTERPDLFDSRSSAAPTLLEGGRLVYRDSYMLLLRDEVRFTDGRRGQYVRVAPARAGIQGAAILPLSESRLLLLCHARHATGQLHWEIPRGFAEPDEEAEVTARRELHEETGLDADSLVPLGDFYPDSGLFAGCVALFLAKIASAVTPIVAEAVEARVHSVADVEAMIANGCIGDSFTMAAFLRARLRGLL